MLFHNPKIAGATGQAILASSRYKNRRSLSKDGGLFAFLGYEENSYALNLAP
ncbi:hypothetical protein [Dyadobacter sp. 3J3]|uniref:hypothetical protein n=1 Tax=Dyadobacter sp. 3J3 TaxID=2606600 RepID=UPI0013590B89|nr:hypothetical protein [Dyadobacter sp. 3J3]